MRRKWQVFVSSTYIDLIHERQACVEAILRSGHIPAGMELFSAGSETQLETIKRWIDDSDIYILLLGGRYGSIEPKSGLSYTEIEYNYAVEKDKPMFAVVLSDSFIDVKVDKEGKGILELENGKILKAFRISALSRISRIVNNQSEIKLTVVESLLDIQNRFDIKGWVRESEIADFNTLFNRNQELFERNNALEKMLKESENRPQSLTKSYFNNLSFLEIKNILSTLEVNMRDNEKASILTLFINFADFLITGLEYNIHNGFNHEGADFHFCIDFVFPKLKILGLAINEKMKETTIYSLTENGERFMAEYFIENLGLDKSC